MQSSFVAGRMTLMRSAALVSVPLVAGGGRSAARGVPARTPALWVVSAKGPKGPGRQRKRKGKPGKTMKDTKFSEEEIPTTATTNQDLAKQFVAQQGEVVSKSVTNDVDFDAKLAALKSTAPAARPADTPLGTPVNQFDGFLSDTNAPPGSAESSDDEPGPRLWVQIGAAVIVGVFVFLYSGSDLQQVSGGVGKVRKGSAELPPEIQRELESEAEKYEAVLAADKNDVEAVEAAAVTYAKLGDYKKADQKLEQLMKLKPGDVEVVRLLAETKAQQGDVKASSEKYEEALKITPDNLEILRGYMTVLASDGKQAKAIEVLQEIRPRALERGNQGVLGSASDPIDIVQLELLTGKVYSDWKGHSADALAVYNSLIDNYKDDFRGYLAKGALLKDIGRAKDADRFFLQARYLAPDSAKPLVEQVKSRPAPDPK